MIKQRDEDGNVVLVLTPVEAGLSMQVSLGATYAALYGLVGFNREEQNFLEEFALAPYLLSDEELVEAILEPHRGHEQDDVETMRAEYELEIPEARARAIETGLLAG